MIHSYFAEHLIADRDRDIRIASTRAGLAALALCCRPSRITTALVSVRERIAHSQRRLDATGCCA